MRLVSIAARLPDDSRVEPEAEKTNAIIERQNHSTLQMYVSFIGLYVWPSQI